MPTFLHTADWHLGKRLHEFWLLDEQREALQRLLEVIDAERPDGVLLAGDVFDAPIPPVKALQLWEWVAEEIVARRGVPLVLIPGNHDHAERLAMNARMARTAGLHVLNQLSAVDRPVHIAGVDIFGVPFHKPPHVRALCGGEGAQARERDDDAAQSSLGDFDYHPAMSTLLDRARAARTPHVPAIVLAHAFVVGGGEESDGEETVLVGGAGGVHPECFEGFDYAALGHLHAPRTLGGAVPVRYAGGLYPYAFDEPGAKSVTLVDVAVLAPERGRRVKVREAPLPVRRQVRRIQGFSFDEVIARGVQARCAKDALAASEQLPDGVEDPDDYLWITVTDRQPIDHATSRLREVHRHALLEQPAIDVREEGRPLGRDARTMRIDEAFLAFYRHVFGEEPSDLEREILDEVLAGDDADADDPERVAVPERKDAARASADEAGEAEVAQEAP